MRLLPLILALFLAACDAPPPELEASISDRARGSEFPPLLPLGALLVETDSLLPEDPGAVGRSLEWRAADLRRRAAQLRALPIN